MKIIAYFALILFLCNICSGQTTLSKKSITGHWMNTKYISILKKEMSLSNLCKNLVKQEPLSALVIKDEQDTLDITFIWGLSEGVHHRIPSQHKNDSMIRIDFTDRGGHQRYILFDTKQDIVIYNDSTKSSRFTRVNREQDQEDLFSELFNEILLSGRYTNKSENYYFNNMGNLSINGHPYKYRIILDCTFLANNIVEIQGYNRTLFYIFKRKKQNLELKQIELDSDNNVISKGKVIRLRKTL